MKIFRKIIYQTTLIFTVLTLFVTKASATEFVITGNGADSQNVVITDISHDTSVSQTNNADIQNSVSQNINTGGNSASGNSGDATITTGDLSANTTIENSANVSIVSLDCCPHTGSNQITLSGNGADSSNNVNATQAAGSLITLNNTANINNNIFGVANTGENTISANLLNASVETGSIWIQNRLKNGPVNVYSVTAGLLDPSWLVDISDNLAGSQNNVDLKLFNKFNLAVNNLSNLTNTATQDANTGGNTLADNMGNISIKTGDIKIGTQIDNGPINTGQVILTCCPKDGPSGGELPPSTPPSTTTTTTTGSGGGGGPSGEVLGASTGQILPATGNNWTIILSLLSALMFFLGLYLRLHPGQDPGKK